MHITILTMKIIIIENDIYLFTNNNHHHDYLSILQTVKQLLTVCLPFLDNVISFLLLHTYLFNTISTCIYVCCIFFIYTINLKL